jgi:hypothetical protein
MQSRRTDGSILQQTNQAFMIQFNHPIPDAVRVTYRISYYVNGEYQESSVSISKYYADLGLISVLSTLALHFEDYKHIQILYKRGFTF